MKLWRDNSNNTNIEIYTFKLIDERMYVLKTLKSAIVIDPFETDELLKSLAGIEEIFVFITHEHFDHISGVNWLKKRINCKVISSKACADIISAPNNGTAHFPLMFITDRETYHFVKANYQFPYVCQSDYSFLKEMNFDWHSHCIYAFETPGHSPGGISILVDGRYLFTGDTLLGNGQELRSINSSETDYKLSLSKYSELNTLSVNVFPGHGEPKILEEIISIVKEYYRWS